MIENDFGLKTARHLEAATEQLDRRISDRLYASRQAALNSFKATEAELVMSAGSFTFNLSWAQKALIVGPLLALLIALAGVNLMQDPNAEIGELDAALLTGELPIDAFLDKDFDTWLKGDE